MCTFCENEYKKITTLFKQDYYDGRLSYNPITIYFCPICGKKLPIDNKKGIHKD